MNWAKWAVAAQWPNVVMHNEHNVPSAAVAKVVRKIWQVPPGLWYGLTKGADFGGLAFTLAGQPVAFPVSDLWIRYRLKQDPSFDTSKITYRQFADLFRQSQAQYGDLIGSDDPDLSAFRRAGGKLLSWHGQSDQLIFPQGTVDYRKRVERTIGGKVDDFTDATGKHVTRDLCHYPRVSKYLGHGDPANAGNYRCS